MTTATEDYIQVILNDEKYKNEEWFNLRHITETIFKAGLKISFERVSEIMRILLSDGVVERTQRERTIVYYRSRAKRTELLKHNWHRKHSNEELGITCDRLGMYW